MRISSSIYLDHQATTPVDPRVLGEMTPYFCDSFGNPHSSDHCFGWESARAVENAAARVARLVGVDADEIVFTSGATESNNLVLLGLGRRAASGKRRRILLSAIEHKCVLAAGRVLENQYGFTLNTIAVDEEGFVDLSALEDSLDDDVLAVSIMAVNNEIGAIQNTAEISRLVRHYGALFHSDAAQAPVAMNLERIGKHADFISLSGHKMYGPKGIGVAVISRHLQSQIEPLVYGGDQQNGLRSGTVPVPLCVGMGAAAELLAADDAEERRKALRRRGDCNGRLAACGRGGHDHAVAAQRDHEAWRERHEHEHEQQREHARADACWAARGGGGQLRQRVDVDGGGHLQNALGPRARVHARFG